MLTNPSPSNKIVLQSIRAVRERLRLRSAIEAGAWGGLGGTVIILPRVFLCENGTFISFIILLLGAIIGTVLGAAVRFFCSADQYAPARQIDLKYRLKDRLLTALTILSQKQATPMEQLQLADAAVYAEAVNPSVVVPYRWPSPLYGMILLLLVTTLIVGFLRNATPVLKTSSERKEMLTALSEQERAIRSSLEKMRTDSVDRSMSELAGAFGMAAAMRPIAKALRARDYFGAADKLNELGTDLTGALSRQERDAVAEQMRQTQQGMERWGPNTLLEATKTTGEAIRRGDEEHYRQGATALAEEFRGQAVRKEIERGLRGKLAAIELAKEEIGAVAQDGADGDGDGNGGSNTKKSDTSGKNWGTGLAGAPASGRETQLDAVRQREAIMGMIGASGESEFRNTTNTDPSRVSPLGREYQERYDDVHKTVEAVLVPEQIPIRQRWVIRDYFLTIRPRDEDWSDQKPVNQ